MSLLHQDNALKIWHLPLYAGDNCKTLLCLVKNMKHCSFAINTLLYLKILK